MENYSQPHARCDMKKDCLVIILYSKDTNHTIIVFTCFQFGSSIAGPKNINHPHGKALISVIHELISGYLDTSDAKHRKTVFPNFTKKCRNDNSSSSNEGGCRQGHGETLRREDY